MAKKKKAARKAAKNGKKASRAVATSASTENVRVEEVGSCSDQELEAAGVITKAGELMSGLANALVREIEARGVDVADLLRTVVASLQRSQPNVRVSGEENGQMGWEYARRQLVRRDFADMPYVRVIGRVAEILLNHRRFQTISAGDVCKVFLVEIPRCLEENHRQNPPPGQQLSVNNVDVTAQPNRRNFNNRMKWLRNAELIQPAAKTAGNKDKGYVLTEYGQNIFDGWPDLSEIPGLEPEGPVRPDSEPRRRS
jgi:hypothetical protein